MRVEGKKNVVDALQDGKALWVKIIVNDGTYALVETYARIADEFSHHYHYSGRILRGETVNVDKLVDRINAVGETKSIIALGR